MKPQTITAPVGFGGANRNADVRVIQELLNRVPAELGGPASPLSVDGICGPVVIYAIHKFQFRTSDYSDGRIDPCDLTWHALNLNMVGGTTALTVAMIGGIHPSIASTTAVANRYRQCSVAPPRSPANSSDDLLDWFCGKLTALDSALQGSATQSWGVIIYGNGSGINSTATKLSEDGRVWGSFDYKKFMEIIDLVVMVLPKGMTYRDEVEGLRKALNARDPEKAATFIFKCNKKIKDIKEAFQAAEQKTTASFPAISASGSLVSTRQTNAPGKTQVSQWVDYDQSGNMYIMIVYSDGSKKYLFGSVFGQREIDNPGQMNWRKVQGKAN